jgi:hypothetical protein
MGQDENRMDCKEAGELGRVTGQQRAREGKGGVIVLL